MRLDDTDRLEAFSDGVMAVVITIMAFSVRPTGRCVARCGPSTCSPSSSSTS